MQVQSAGQLDQGRPRRLRPRSRSAGPPAGGRGLSLDRLLALHHTGGEEGESARAGRWARFAKRPNVAYISPAARRAPRRSSAATSDPHAARRASIPLVESRARMFDTDLVTAPPEPAAAPRRPTKARGAFNVERVTWLRHWTPSLFSLKTTRDPAFRFASGQFVMLGLEVGGQAAAARLFHRQRRPGPMNWSSTRSRSPTAR